jgi:hypothetical protein
VAMPEGAAEVCQLDGSCARSRGRTLPVGTAPVLVRLTG